MSLSKQYRRHADDCVRVAQLINNHVDKALLLQMAQAWRRLAERAEAQKADADRGED